MLADLTTLDGFPIAPNIGGVPSGFRYGCQRIGRVRPNTFCEIGPMLLKLWRYMHQSRMQRRVKLRRTLYD